MKNRAFTLIELLVVVLIIGILSAIALPQYRKAVDKSRLMEQVIQGRALLEAQQLFVTANGKMSQDLDELDIGMPVSSWYCGTGYCVSQKNVKEAKLEVSRYYGNRRLALMCRAGKNNIYAQQLCVLVGGTEDHEQNDIKYYLIHKK